MKGRRPTEGAAKTGGPAVSGCGEAGGSPVHPKMFRRSALEELVRGPAGKHLLQDAAVVGVGQAAQ